MPVEQGEVVEREVSIAARPETVFAFFTDPEKIILWKGRRAELDPRPGGVYRVDLNGRDVVVGEYLEVEPPTRVVFTWGWEGEAEHGLVPPGSSRVEVELVPEGDRTVVRLRHVGLPPEALAVHADGWDHYLGRLVEAAEGRDPGRDAYDTDE